MAWNYADYDSTDYDAATQLSRLALHMAEVRNKISADMSAAGNSVAHGSLVAYLAQLQAEHKRLLATSGSSSLFTRGVAR